MTPDKDLSARLLPCPFCGGEARLYSSPKILPGSSCNVECQKCLAESGWVTTEAEAIAAWNRRVPADHERAVQDAVAKAVEACAVIVSELWPDDEHARTLHPELFAKIVNALFDEAAIRSRGVAG